MEPVNVQCARGRNSRTLHYDLKGITDASWNIVPKDGQYVARFEATAGGRKYGHKSAPFPARIKNIMDNASKKTTDKDFQVQIKTSSDEIGSYFGC